MKPNQIQSVVILGFSLPSFAYGSWIGWSNQDNLVDRFGLDGLGFMILAMFGLSFLIIIGVVRWWEDYDLQSATTVKESKP